MSDGNGASYHFSSYVGDLAALFWIHTALLQWRRGLEKVVQTLPVPLFTVELPLQQGYPTCGRRMYKVNSSIKQRPLMVASWNVRNLQDTGLGALRRPAHIARELARCDIDIAALSEANLPEEASLVEIRTDNTFL